MEEADSITRARLDIWKIYHQSFEALEAQDRIRRPVIPSDCTHNAHMYYLLLPSLDQRTAFIANLKERDITPVFHYVPLHNSPMGRRFGRSSGDLKLTENLSERLVRLPLWLGIGEHQALVVQQVIAALQ